MLSSSTVTVSWNASSGATSYIGGIHDIAANTDVVTINTGSTSTAATLSPGKQYRWYVVACNSTGCSSSSALYYFQTPTSSGPGAITGVTPLPSPAQVNQSITFTVSGTGTCGGLSLTFEDGASASLSGPFPLTTTHAYVSAGTFTATAIGIMSCTGSASTPVTVNGINQPTIAWTTPPPSAVTSGTPFSVAWSISGGSPTHVNVHWDPTNPGGPGNPSGNINTSCQQSSTSCSTVSPTSSPATLTAPTVTTSTVVRYLVHATVSGTDIFTDTRDVTVNPVPVTTGTLSVITTPVNGDIFVDGMLRGNGSISIPLSAGSYTVSFGAVGGYTTPSPQSVPITAGQLTSIAGTYVPTGPTTGTLSVITTPVNGDIFVDGTLRGNGSISIQLPAGSYTVSFGDVSGYTTPAPQPVTITGNETMVITVAYDLIVLEKVSLLSPSNDATGVSITPTFGWSGVNGANRYWLMVAINPSDFPADPNATSCPNCVITGSTDSTSHALPHNFPFGGKSGTLSINTPYYWKVQAWNTNGAQGNYSDALRFTTKAPESEPPQRVETSVDTTCAPTPGDKAVVITHGWNSSAATIIDEKTKLPSWPVQMAQAVCKKLDNTYNGCLPKDNPGGLSKICQANGWDVWVKDWRDDANALPLLVDPLAGIKFPVETLPYAARNGATVAIQLWKSNYQHYHLIAHSAGSMLIDWATYWLKQYQHRQDMRIHETFLDAYGPAEAESYGAWADWADNYVDRRYLGTELFLLNAYNIDTTPPLLSRDLDLCGPICAHSQPYRFYGLSILNDDSFVGDADYKQADPVGSTAGVGYPLSVEAGQSISGLKDILKKGEKCVVRDGLCYPDAPPLSRWDLKVLGPSFVEGTVQVATTYVKIVEGAANSLYSSIKMGAHWFSSLVPHQVLAVRGGATSGAATEEPSYLVVNVTTTSPVNTLRFNWSFAAAGEGLLRVFVGGNLVREIDQRHVTPSSPETEEIYIGGVGEPLPPGTHRITFRLDGFGANASGVELTNVELGLKAGPLAFPADTLPVGEQGVAYVYDLLAEGGLPPYTWSLVKGKLPGGLTLDTAGTITGTPTKAKTKTFTVQVTDAAGGSATQDLSLQIVKSVKIKTKKLRGGTVGIPYSSTLKTKGGIAPLAFSLVGGALPPGLTLDPGTGQVSGTPTAPGTFDFVAQVTSSGGSSHQKNIRIKIK